MTSRLAVDIGGTFTDFTMVDDRTGDVFVEKCLTTPGQPELDAEFANRLRDPCRRQPFRNRRGCWFSR